ncbi:MAG: nitric oxide reductase [Deltaproteobacteria bacterium CG11_big_fil_rev_8_21_14_0_20_45_16]|nr:MAG: nitric oxide reductase [Deltaproteobacteria bacterium CG11_big_fil_rev_8_21_14_0_20_45_16]
MLSKSSAKLFFLVGTGLCVGTFLLLTIDTIRRVPEQTNQQNLSESAIRGKHLWETNNCMGCHTILGEGAYYAPELTKVYERRGPKFIAAMLKDPYAMYPGQRKMVRYDFSDSDIQDLTAFMKWIGEMDLNGFPPKPNIGQIATIEGVGAGTGVAQTIDRPIAFNQMCIVCHKLRGQGGDVGPALDGVGSRLDRDYIVRWLHDPQAVKPGTLMPKLPLSEEEIVELSAFLSQLKEDAK